LVGQGRGATTLSGSPSETLLFFEIFELQSPKYPRK
jgi:hypothetical protein